MSKNRTGTIVIVTIAIAFIAIGIVNKEPTQVLQKAIHICLECIGIG